VSDVTKPDPVESIPITSGRILIVFVPAAPALPDKAAVVAKTFTRPAPGAAAVPSALAPNIAPPAFNTKLPVFAAPTAVSDERLIRLCVSLLNKFHCVCPATFVTVFNASTTDAAP
jgi:hypothetical protein